MNADATAIAANIANVRERVALARSSAAERSGRAAAEVKIIAVSKTFSAAAIRAAYDAGVREFGENRVQEWESKRAQLADLDATFHMLGHVQSNKASRVEQLFHRVDSLDSLALAKKLDAAAAAEKKRLPALIEVHLSGEESKSGVTEVHLASLAEATSSLAHLDLQGLMTIPPYFDDAERARPYFRKLRELRDGLTATLGRELPVLSMGMSHDFEVAIEEGATEVRIGTAIFGGREQKSVIAAVEIAERDGGITFAVRVAPRASRNAIEGVHAGALKVRLTAPPLDGRANSALRRLLADRLNVPMSAVRIVSGEKSRTKRVMVSGVSRAQAAEIFESNLS